MFWRNGGRVINRSGSPLNKQEIRLCPFRPIRITSAPFQHMGDRDENVARSAGGDRPDTTPAADAGRGISGLVPRRDGETARNLLGLAGESELAHRIERAILPGSRNRLAVTPGDRLGARSRIIVPASLVGSGLAAKAARRCRGS